MFSRYYRQRNSNILPFSKKESTMAWSWDHDGTDRKPFCIISTSLNLSSEMTKAADTNALHKYRG